jgi:hypothetical protein
MWWVRKSGKFLGLVEPIWDRVIMGCRVGGLASAREGGRAVRSLVWDLMIIGCRVGEVEVGLVSVGLDVGRGWMGGRLGSH